MTRPARLALPLVLLACAALAAIGGCAGSAEAVEVGPDARPSARAVAALADSLARPGADRRAVAARALARGGATPLGDPVLGDSLGLFAWSGAPVAAGLVPGRHPLARPDLVVGGTRIDGPAAPAVLEAARVLAERARWTHQPERTVEVVLWSGLWTDRQAVSEVLRAPVWPRDNVRAVLVVGDAAVAPVDSVAVEAMAPGAGGVELASALIERVTALARRPPPPPDSTRAR